MKQRDIAADLCVVGGGVSGVCAALAAARNGARVVLVHDRSVLGGNASSEIRMHIVGASCSGRRPGAREPGLIDELRVEDSVRNPHRSPHLFDLMLYDKVVSEPNITLLLDSSFADCAMEGNRIHSVRALSASTEEEFVIEAALYADCSGDSHLGVAAGADARTGREAREEYGEPHGQDVADSKTLGSTILFMASRKNEPVPFHAPAWARKFSEEDLNLRSHREWEYGYWWAEWGGELDTIGDNRRIRHELLRIALGVWDHVKNGCSQPWDDPAAAYEKWMDGAAPKRSTEGPENWSLDWVGMLPGKRESRRLLGPHVLTEADVVEGRIFDDEVAYGGWWIDMHPPGGVDAVHEYPAEQVETPYLYSIPLRALVSRNVSNLLFAGRNISATHVAFASTRVMATCAVVGQAVGTAAAFAASRGIGDTGALLEIAAYREIQQMLLAGDAFLLGVRAEEGLEHSARITASTEQKGCEARLVVNGVTRATSNVLHPSLGDCANQWRSEMLPAWVELRWDEPQEIHGVQLTFDTGFERELTLSMSDAFNSKMLRGAQPETVKSYELHTAGGVAVVVADNYQRLRQHDFVETVVTDFLRLQVTATHGAAEARVFQIRVY